MSENSKIEWTDHTFNSWLGCTKVFPGCDHCYAETRMDKRLHIVNWGAGQPRKRTSAANWREPIKWNARHEQFLAEHGRRQRVFCASLADVFDNEVDPEWRKDLWRLIWDTPNLDWLLLTKRIGNAKAMLNDFFEDGPLPNMWIGASIVNQEEADRDIPKLLDVPARVHFLSMEPLLAQVKLNACWLTDGCGFGNDSDPARSACLGCATNDRCAWPSQKLDWIIVGGESGPKARPMQTEWVQSLRDQCTGAGVPFFFKQWGEWLGPLQDGNPDHKVWELNATDQPVYIGKKAAGRMLDGRTWDELPNG